MEKPQGRWQRWHPARAYGSPPHDEGEGEGEQQLQQRFNVSSVAAKLTHLSHERGACSGIKTAHFPLPARTGVGVAQPALPHRWYAAHTRRNITGARPLACADQMCSIYDRQGNLHSALTHCRALPSPSRRYVRRGRLRLLRSASNPSPHPGDGSAPLLRCFFDIFDEDSCAGLC